MILQLGSRPLFKFLHFNMRADIQHDPTGRLKEQ